MSTPEDNDDPTTLLACPECDSNNIRRLANHYNINDCRWRCHSCDIEFDDAVRRELKSKGSDHPSGGLATQLLEADPDDVGGGR